MSYIKILSLIGFVFVSLALHAQVPLPADSIYVKNHPVKIKVRQIVIIGNKRTKNYVILRQLTFKEGDSLNLISLTREFQECKENLFNISLFTEVTITLENWFGFEADVYIEVKERWYTWPAPAFDIYDRNFNTWWVTHHRDLTRIQFGGRFNQQNVGGTGQTFNASALFGYAERFDLGYNFPFIDRRLTKGLKVSAFYAQQRSIPYESSYNQEVYFTDSTKFIRESYGGQVEFSLKPKIHFKQTFTLGYNHVMISDTIRNLNPFYLQSGTVESYFFATYSIVNDLRDRKSYALSGSYEEFTINQTGLGILSNLNITNLYLVYQKYQPLSDNFFFAALFNLKYSFPIYQPYYNQRGLGYGDAYVSGYEYYVIDGQAYGLARFQLHYKLLDFHLPVFYYISKEKAEVPFTILPKIYYDAGYVVDETHRTDNPLANTLLFGYGVGIDVVTAYNFTFRFEYSINREGQKGLYLHFSALF